MPSPKTLVAQDEFSTISKAVLSVPQTQPGTQCHTSATSLRKQPSKLPFKRPTQTRGGVQGRTPPAMRQGRRIGRNTHPCSAPLPKEGA
ncbi:MAG TPA: hypothetical protein VIM51_06215 [Desulfosporosinus sp.]